MEIRLEVKDVKAMMERLKIEEKQSFITNARLSEKATKWLKEHKYAMKEYEGVIALAESEEKLPSKKEIEIFGLLMVLPKTKMCGFNEYFIMKTSRYAHIFSGECNNTCRFHRHPYSGYSAGT